MKKVLSALILTSFLIVPLVGLADVYGGEEPIDKPEELISTGADVIALIENIGNWAFAILLAIAGIFLIMAGFYFVTAGGNPESVTKARQMLINALIGVAIGLGAKGLVAVIGSILGA